MSGPPGEVAPDTQRRLRAHREIAVSVPAPDDAWALAETDLEQADLHLLKALGVIRAAGTEQVTVAATRTDGGGNYRRTRWRTDRAAYEWIQTTLTDAAECPAPECRATGVHNPRDAAGYRCTADDCDAELSEAQARRLLR